MLNNIIKPVLNTRVFRISLFLLSVFLYYNTLYPLLLGTKTETLDLVWGIITIPLLFMLIFKHIKRVYYTLVGVLLAVVSLVTLSYGSQTILVLLLYDILVVVYILIAFKRFSHPFSRFGFVILNIIVASGIYIFHLGYSPISLKGYKVIDNSWFREPWKMVLVEKDSLLGIVDATTGQEIVPIVFTDIVKQSGELPMLIRKLTDEQKLRLFKETVEASESYDWFNSDSSDIRIPFLVTEENIFRTNINKKIHTSQEEAIKNVSDPFYKNKEKELMITFGRFFWKFRNGLLSHILRGEAKPDQPINDLVDFVVPLYEEVLDSMVVRTKQKNLTFNDINEIRLLLMRTLSLSSLIKTYNSDNWQHMSWPIKIVYESCIYSEKKMWRINHNYALCLDGVLFNADSLSWNFLDLKKRNLTAIRKAYINACTKDWVLHRDSIAILKYGELLNYVIGKNDELNNMNLFSSFKMKKDSFDISHVRDFLKDVNKFNEWRKNTKNGMMIEWNKISMDDIYKCPDNRLDSLIFIRVPECLNFILKEKSAVDLHSSVEEISAYLYFSSFLRGYNNNNLNELRKWMETPNFLFKFVQSADSIQQESHKDILELIREFNL